MTTSSFSRRTALKAAGGVTGAAFLAACGNGSSSGSGGTGKGALNVWGGVPPENGPDELVAAFHREHPDIKVTYTRYVNDDQGKLKLDTSLQGGVPVDVFYTYDTPTLTKRVAAGLTVDLTEKVSADSELAQFGPDKSPAANIVIGGKVYSIPAQKSPTIVYVNDSMLSEAGLTLPDDWDIDDYHELARKLGKGDSVFGTYNTPPIQRYTIGPNYYYSPDGKSSSFDNPIWREYFNLALEMQADGSALPQRTIMAEKLQTFVHGPLLTGRVAMLPAQLFVLRYVSDLAEFPHDFKIRAVPNPAPVKGKEFWNDGAIGDHLSISAKSENQEAAWMFVKYCMLNGNFMIKGGRLPSVLDASKRSQAIADLLGPDRDKLYDVASFEKAIFETPYKIPIDTITTAAVEVDTMYKRLHGEVLLGQRSVDDFVTQAAQQADKAIKAAG